MVAEAAPLASGEPGVEMAEPKVDASSGYGES
jgi:hypothetical protein